MLTSAAGFGGTFTGTAVCDSAGCRAGIPSSDKNQTVPPFAITHVQGFDGSGGSFTFRICVDEGSEALSGPLGRAIDTWNNLLAMVENCVNCDVWEDSPTTPTTLDAESVLLHELGHCPFALEHPDRNWDANADGVFENTSFTRSWGASPPEIGDPASGGIQVGPDFIRGSPDDIQLGPLKKLAESVSWFRRSDNDPFVVDGTVIDTISYSRSTASNLPAGHNWAANGNRRVGEVTFGLEDTQAVMYSLVVEGQRILGLSADEVNMVKMARTGEDLTAGTGDDYTVTLELSCVEPVDVLVKFGTLPAGVGAACVSGVDYSFTQNPFLARHFTLEPGPASEDFEITLNDQIIWDTNRTVFADGFESGDTSGWSETSP